MMFRCLLLGALFIAGSTYAQPGPPPNLPPAADGATTETLTPPDAAEEPEDEANSLLKGDIVELQSGKKLEGVQVIRKTAKGYEIQTLPDLPPMVVPLKQVKNIVYDEKDPRRAGEEPQKVAAGTPAPNFAQEVSRELHEKLVLPLEPASFTDLDFIEVLNATVLKAGVPLDIAPRVREMPEGQRAWTVNIEGGTNSLTLLTSLADAFPTLEVTNELDRVVIRMKPEGADAAAPAPAPGLPAPGTPIPAAPAPGG